MLKSVIMTVIPILLAFLLVIIFYFFSAEFQGSLSAFPGLSTGLVAVLTVLTTGVIGLIVKVIDIEHTKNERRNQRTYAIFDEKYKVIISGINVLEIQFQGYGQDIVSIIEGYSPSLSTEQLKGLLLPQVEIYDQTAILLTEIASLDDGDLNALWKDVKTAWVKLVMARQGLIELLEKLIENPGIERPKNLDEASTEEELSKITGTFVTFAGLCKKRLTELRIVELGTG
jgi:hypothetical protein